MSYEDKWYLENRIALQRLYGIITIEDVELARTGLNKFLEEGIPLVHILVDVTDVEKFLTNIAAMQRMIPNMDNPKMGWLIIYGSKNVFLRFIASALAQFGMPGVRMRMLTTLDESLTFLQGQDTTLGNLMSFGDTG